MPKKNFDFIYYSLIACAVFLSAWNYCFFCYPKIVKAAEVTPALFYDNFNSYNLGDVNGQGYWYEGFADHFNVEIKNGSDYWLHADGANSGIVASSTPVSTSSLMFDVNVAGIGEASVSLNFFDADDNYIFNILLIKNSTENYCVSNGQNWPCIGEILYPTSTTIRIGADWDYSIKQYRIYDGENWHSYTFSGTWTKGIDRVAFIQNWVWNFYVDNFTDSPLGISQQVFGISPASGSEVSDIFDNLTIGYENLDLDDIDGLILEFKNDLNINSGLNAVIPKENLDPSGSGETQLSFSTFEFDTKENWNLFAYGYRSIGGFNHYWTDNLVLTPYFITLTDSTLSDTFNFSDPATWYASHSRYASSTAFFDDAVGLFTPIFVSVGTFVTGIANKFNTEQAYQTGYNFGAVLPTINGYVEQIDTFFGDFPIGSIFKYIMLVLIAMFIIRLVFKFIPFFG